MSDTHFSCVPTPGGAQRNFNDKSSPRVPSLPQHNWDGKTRGQGGGASGSPLVERTARPLRTWDPSQHPPPTTTTFLSGDKTGCRAGVRQRGKLAGAVHHLTGSGREGRCTPGSPSPSPPPPPTGSERLTASILPERTKTDGCPPGVVEASASELLGSPGLAWRRPPHTVPRRPRGQGVKKMLDKEKPQGVGIDFPLCLDCIVL